MSRHPTFAFETEFAPDGHVIGGAGARYLPREEADALAEAARKDAETRARQSALARSQAALERIEAHLAPVPPALEALADTLRREAAELALVAARKIAGMALDAFGPEAAADGVARTLARLKGGARVIVSAAPEAQAAIEERAASGGLAGSGIRIVFVADPGARPGDWRVEWDQGMVAFNREDVEAELEEILARRMADPIGALPGRANAS